MKRIKSKPEPSLHIASVVNLSHDAKGVARIDGKVTFIQGALPDETVEFQYTQVKKDFDQGRLISVIHPSPLRVEPKCPHYSLCGGCSLQHLSEKEQIRFKQEQLLDLLSRFGRTKPQELLAPLTSVHWHYRNQARLSVRFVEKKQRLMLGFRERNNPRYILDMAECPILNAKLDADFIPLKALLERMEDKHSIAQVEVSAGDEEIGLIFRNLQALTPNDELKIQQFAQQYQYKIYFQPQDKESVYCFYPPDSSEFLTYSLPDYRITFQFLPTDFVQVNPALNRAMVALVLELMDLKSSDIVLDLFCGLGNFSLPMAQFCSKVIGVEGSNKLVDRASMNAALNQLINVEFQVANLEADLRNNAEVENLFSFAFNKILIDPPRAGAWALVQQMDLFNPERIIYVSCNPVTLARDTDVLVNQKGYVLIKAGVMDMFPHTAHVESIALFQKGCI